MRNILVVSIAAPPYTTPESIQCSKYLKYLVQNKETQVSLLTAKFADDSLGWRKVDQKYQSVLNGLDQIVKVPAYYDRITTGIVNRLNPAWFKKPDNEKRFINGWRKAIQELRNTPDIIYSRSSPSSSTLMALRLKLYYQVPWVIHLSDPWTLSPLMKLRGKEKDFHSAKEKECLTLASKICMTSQEQIDLYKSNFPGLRDKFELFPNVYDDDEVAGSTVDFEGKLIFVHTGNFYGQNRSPEILLRAIELSFFKCPELVKNCEFLFAGFQNRNITKLMGRYAQYGVKYLGPLDYSDCQRLQRSATVMVLIDLELPSKQAMFMPSKALDYMATRKPILALTAPNSTLDKILTNKYGTCFAPHDVEGASQYILKMSERFAARDIIFNTPYQLEHKYSAKFNCRRLTGLFDELKTN